MHTRIADKYAQTVIEHYGHEGTFDIALDSVEIQPIADALIRAGCDVVQHKFKPALTITVPRDKVSPNGQKRAES